MNWKTVNGYWRFDCQGSPIFNGGSISAALDAACRGLSHCTFPRRDDPFAQIVAGKLGLSGVTIKIHRGHVMQEMRADSLAGLVRMVGKLQGAPPAGFLLHSRHMPKDTCPAAPRLLASDV